MAELEEYFDALATADAARAADVLVTATHRGVPPQRLIREVVAPAQQRVGEMWFNGSWSIADEHAATAVSEQALSLLCPPGATPQPALRVVVACAEGEWHTLAARLAAELTRNPGVDVVFLGGSTFPKHLRRHLLASSPDVLALSCTMPTNLIGASRSIGVAREEGVPVVVGGRAWGSGQQRARRLGADLRLDDPGELAAVVAQLPRTRTPPAAVPVEALLLDAPPQELLRLALDRQRAGDRWLRERSDYQLDQTMEDLTWLARHAAAGVACADASVLGEWLRWRLELLPAQDVPVAVVLDGCDYLADAVEPDAPQGAHVLRSQAAALRSERARRTAHEGA